MNLNSTERIRWWLLALTLLAGAPPVCAQRVSQPATLAAVILRFLPIVRDGSTVGDWLKVYHTPVRPTSPLSADTPADGCASARVAIPVGHADTAYATITFYPPAAPVALTLPAASPALIQQCSAGIVWISVPNPDTTVIDAMRQQTNVAFGRSAGPVDSSHGINWIGAAEWIKPMLRDTSGVAIVVAATHARKELRNDTSAAVAALVADRLGYHLRADGSDGFDSAGDAAATRASRAAIDTMTAIAALPVDVAAGMRTFRAMFEPDSGDPRRLTERQRDSFAVAMRRWLVAGATLPPARHAAALFAANAILMESSYSVEWGETEDSMFRRKVAALGAQFVEDPLGGGFDFNDTWLVQAWRTAPGSRAGQFALLQLMSEGFETNTTCSAQHGLGFRAVIREGARFLAAHGGSPIAPRIHLMLAQAYGDIVALASGGGYLAEEDSSQTVEFRPEEAEARRRAIAEYRVAVATLTDAAARQDAWLNAWRLLAGLAPVQTRFVCVYD